MQRRPGFASGHQATITEVALMMGPLRGRGGSHVVEEQFLEAPTQLAEELWLGRFPIADRIIAACRATGENWDPPFEWSTYAFWRVHAPYSVDRTVRFDADRRLSTCIQLSRLVRPTSIGYSRAARVLTREDERLQIIPGRYAGRGTVSYVADQDEDWIRDEDVPRIRELVARFTPKSLPNRVKRAMMYHEYLHGLPDLDVRWPLVVTAAEALVHTDERKKVFGPRGLRVTAQFTCRLTKLATKVPGLDWSESYLEEAYEHRSSFAHGGGRGGVSEAESLRRYRRLESGLRSVLCSAILDPDLASIFKSDDAIRSALNP